MVFQDYALFPHMTVAENVAFGLQAQARRPRRARERGSPRCSRSCASTGYEDRRPAAAIGGPAPARRARPCARQPARRAAARRAARRARPEAAPRDAARAQADPEDTGTTFVYVTHDQEEALTMSDRIAVMDGGVVQQVDAPAGALRATRDRFVADFIGTSNNLSISGDRASDGLVVMEPRRGHADRRPRPRDRADCRITVRPEKIRIGCRARRRLARSRARWSSGLPRLAVADRGRDRHG